MSALLSRRDGGCLCGTVRFTAIPSKLEMSACHCDQCRRWTGAVFMGVDCGTDVAIEAGEPHLGVYRSSDYGERVFCTRCGSALFWRLQDGSKIEVSAQFLDDPSGLPLATEFFIDVKPDTYAFAGTPKTLTKAETLARMSRNGSNG